MNKIILFSPSTKNLYGSAPPYPSIGLLSISSVLKIHGFESIFIEEDFYSSEKIIKEMLKKNVLAVFATSTTPLFYRIKKLALYLYNNNGPPVIIGGPHVWAVKEKSITKGILAGILGEGEQIVIKLAKYLQEKKDISSLPGVITKNKINKPLSYITDLDLLPFPNYKLARPWYKYRPPEAIKYPAIPVMLSRGCNGNCIFCSTPDFWGKKIRRLSPERSIDLIEYLIKYENAQEIHFADDDLTGDREWIDRFCSYERKKNFKIKFLFLNGLRASNLDKDLLQQLKYSNFKNVGFGIESGDKKIFSGLGKNMTLEKINSSIEIASKLGFSVWGFYIFGLPGESYKTIKNSINHSLKHRIDFAKFFILQPYPGTQINKIYKMKGFLKTKIKSSLYGNSAISLPGISGNDLEKKRKEAYIKFYLNPKKIFNIFRKLNSFNTKSFFSSFLFVIKIIKNK